jgi:hypothetical protein
VAKHSILGCVTLRNCFPATFLTTIATKQTTTTDIYADITTTGEVA